MRWPDINGIEVSVGESKHLSIDGYGDFEAVVIGTDHDCRDSITFMLLPVITRIRMSDSDSLIGGYRNSPFVPKVVSDIRKGMPAELVRFLPRLAKGYDTDNGVTNKILMNPFVPSVDELVGSDRYGYFEDVGHLGCFGEDVWTRSGCGRELSTFHVDGTVGTSSPDATLGLALFFTFVRQGVKRMYRADVGYPESVGFDSDIDDYVRFDNSLDDVHKTYYPIMFCV